MTITVREISPDDFPNWDAFVLTHPDSTFCHLSGWKTVVENGARQQCPYMMAEQDGNVVGVLPLTLRKSWLFGNALTSSMFAVYGGAIASTPEAYDALDVKAWEYAQQQELDVLSYRTVVGRHSSVDGWVSEDTTAATFHKPLKENSDDILLDIPRKQRAVVRKSLKNGLSCLWDADVNVFYKLYAASVRNLGTPVFPKALFTEFVRVFGENVEIQVINTSEGKPVASLMSFYFGDAVLPYYAGGTPEARQYGAHDFMYYQLMLRAAGKGKTLFDFGRSKVGTGPYKFKCNWGFEPTALQYEHRVLAGAQPPDLSPTNKKFELMVKVWKKLPLPMANTLGPLIARHLG